MTTIRIWVINHDNRNDKFIATTNWFPDKEFHADHVDSAMGWVIRELWLAGIFDKPVELLIDYDTDQKGAQLP